MRGPWIIEQTWKHVFFLHSRTEPEALQELVPFELDLFEGAAVLSVVPFRMEGIRFRFTPVVPWLSSLWELNLRTYVKVGGRRGIYFFTLDTDSRLGCWIANRFFHLPYRLAEMGGLVTADRFKFGSRRAPLSFKLEADLLGTTKEKTALDLWATERYRLFTKDRHGVFEGKIMHEPWVLEEVAGVSFEDRFSMQLPVVLNGEPESVSYAREMLVRFQPFRKLR